MDALGNLVAGMQAGWDWELMGRSEDARALLQHVLAERVHSIDHRRFLFRTNLQKKADAAVYAGVITEDGNQASGPYQGTSFVWFPGEGGSVAVLVVGTEGFGADTEILGRPGHRRRLAALSRLHGGRLWVKPDLLELGMEVPDSVSRNWPTIDAALRSYTQYIYAAVPVRPGDATGAQIVGDLLDLFLDEHRVRLKGQAKTAWSPAACSCRRTFSRRLNPKPSPPNCANGVS